MTLPLAGYRVLELAHLIAGPVCGKYLADMGADVVKIEQPSGGDAPLRRSADGSPGDRQRHAGRGRTSEGGAASHPEHGCPLQRTPAPALGEHTDVVLAEAGLEPAEVARLRSNRVIF